MKYFLLLFCLFNTANLFAQADTENPVSWTFTGEKAGNKYVVSATATIKPGWHVFTTNPGGDGLLIPTELTVHELVKAKIPVTVVTEGEAVTKEIDGLGKVNFYEHTTRFSYTFDPLKTNTYIGHVYFQCCNDHLCLAPAEIPFSVTIK